MQTGAISIVLAGDLVLDEPDATYWLEGIAPALRSADVAIGHLEVPHSDRGHEMAGDVPAPGAPPNNLAALANAGFDMVSLAGNHIADCGGEGIADTMNGLGAEGIAYAGAGMNISEAREPAVIVQNGVRIALLSYNCVGPQASWASVAGPGCAYLPLATSDGSPVSPAAPLQTILPQARDILQADVNAASDWADLVLVALHKGIVHTPAKLAPYEREISQLAIDAGADAVIGHHAHIVRGIEFYRGRPIFHGLGNGCVVTRALSPDQDHPARREWAQKRKELFGFEPDPAYYLAPFHPEAVNAFLGQIAICWTDGVPKFRVGIVPVHVEAPGRPVLAQAGQFKNVCTYVEKITKDAGLPPIAISADGWVENMG